MSQTAAPNPWQPRLSEILQLLRHLPQSRPTNERRCLISPQHRILEAIATVFSSGPSADLFAAAFNAEANDIVLAKNGNPTESDLEFANEFFSFTLKPEAKGPVDLFSFLLQRRPDGLNKRIRQVHDAIADPKFCNHLEYALRRLGPNGRVEFSRGQGFIQDNFKGKDPLSVLKSCQDIISEQTQKAFDETTNVSTRSRIYTTIINAANVIAHCSLIQEPFLSNTIRKVKMHAIKAYRYFHIGHVFREAKQRSSRGEPVRHRWVKDIEFIGSGEGKVQLGAKNIRDAMINEFGWIPPGIEWFLNGRARLPTTAGDGKKQWHTTVHTSIHPEIRLAFDLASVLKGVHPVGLSKRSCLACLSWLDICYSGIQWVPSDVTRRRPDESWAIPGNVHLVGEAWSKNVLLRIQMSLACFSLGD